MTTGTTPWGTENNLHPPKAAQVRRNGAEAAKTRDLGTTYSSSL